MKFLGRRVKFPTVDVIKDQENPWRYRERIKNLIKLKCAKRKSLKRNPLVNQ